MEKERVWAILFRMSTDSSIMIRTPFIAKDFDGNKEDDQLDAGAWWSWAHGWFVDSSCVYNWNTNPSRRS